MTTIKDPPHNDEAELAVLGAIYLRNSAMDDAAIREEDFYRTAHRKVWAAMRALHERHEAIDPVTLTEELTKAGDYESVGGIEFIARLGDATPTSANVAHYAEIVAKHAQRRRIIEDLHDGLARAYDTSIEPDAVAADLDSRLVGIVSNRTSGPRSMAETLQETMSQISEAAAGNVRCVSTGFHRLDDLLGGGFFGGDLVIIGARPGVGKTALALNIAESLGVGRGATLFYSLEMPRQSLGGRLVGSAAEVSWKVLRGGRITEGGMSRVIRAASGLYDLPIYIDDESFDLSRILAGVRSFARSEEVAKHGGLSLVIVDYAQLINVDSDAETREREVALISRSLKMLAKQLDIPIVGLFQLNRACEQRENKRPIAADLRESGSGEQDCDVLIFIYREWLYEPTNENREDAELIVRKARSGEVGTAHVRFRPELTRFEDKARLNGRHFGGSHE